jgi:pimeloyl-ACP methyl ester carboxylesterase
MRDRKLITGDGTMIAYRTGGRGGPALVFVHGWCSNLTHWDAQLGHFAASHRVLAVDRRGHGRSEVSAGGYTPARHAEDLAEVVRRERFRDLVLVAHAGGGPSALSFVDRYPNLVRGLVLIDTNISDRTTLGRPHSAGRSALGRLVDQLSGPDAASRFEAMYRGFFSALAGELAEEAVRTAMQVPLRVARADLASLAADSEGPARRFARPVLWLTVEPADVVRLRSVFAEVHFGLVVGSGHFAHLEVPAQVNAMIERYLALIAEPDARPRRSPRRDLVRTDSANQATDIRR